MAAQDLTIKELVGRLVDKEIALPEMQRDYVWSINKVVELLDSLYQQYPTGSILTWKTSKPVSTRKAAVPQEKRAEKELLLDGQQRLTSLAAVLTGQPLEIGGASRPINIMFNLDYKELEDPDIPLAEGGDSGNGHDKKKKPKSSMFAPHSNKLAQQSNWVSVFEALTKDYDELATERAGSSDLKNPKVKTYIDNIKELRKIEDYTYRVHTLVNRKLQEVTEIFVRINSQGTGLAGAELALAYMTAEWPSEKNKDGILPSIDKYIDKAAQVGYPIKRGTLARNLVVFATKKSKFDSVPDLNRKALEENWKKSSEGMDYAINFMRGIGFYSLDRLSSPYFLITAAMVAAQEGYRPSKEVLENLRFWVFMANLKGRYSLASESILTKDVAAAKNSLELIRNLETHLGAGSLDIEPNSMVGLNKNSVYSKVLGIMLNCRDWNTGLPIDPFSLGRKNSTELHHIFPKSRLNHLKIDSKKVNDMANFALLSAVTNNEISNELPEVYLARIEDKDLQDQFIPTDRELWKIENYEAFLNERRRLIAQGIKDFLNVDKFKKKLKKK